MQLIQMKKQLQPQLFAPPPPLMNKWIQSEMGALNATLYVFILT